MTCVCQFFISIFIDSELLIETVSFEEKSRKNIYRKVKAV